MTQILRSPGTPLNEAWAHLRAPGLAKAYWKLSEDAMWIDALKCMFADESASAQETKDLMAFVY